MKCRKCGGNRREDGGCNICELLDVGNTFALSVEGGTQTTGWPLRSLALAVHPKQAEQANARAKRHGINVVYDRHGVPNIPDRNERRKLLKLEAFHDNNSFTGY